MWISKFSVFLQIEKLAFSKICVYIQLSVIKIKAHYALKFVNVRQMKKLTGWTHLIAVG